MVYVACCMGHQVIATFDNNSTVPVQARAEFNRFLKFKVAMPLLRPMPCRLYARCPADCHDIDAHPCPAHTHNPMARSLLFCALHLRCSRPYGMLGACLQFSHNTRSVTPAVAHAGRSFFLCEHRSTASAMLGLHGGLLGRRA